MANFCLANRQRLLANIGWDSLMIPRSLSLKRIVLWTWSRSVFSRVPLSPRRKKGEQINVSTLLFMAAFTLLFTGVCGGMVSKYRLFTVFPSRKWSGVCRVRNHTSEVLKTGFSIMLIIGSCFFFVRDSRVRPSEPCQAGWQSPSVGFWVNQVRVISGPCSVTQPWNSAAGDLKHSYSSAQTCCHILLYH